MRYLLDTHVALWILQGADIPKRVTEILDDTSTEIFVSITSAWEVAIKISTGKLMYTGGVSAFLDDIELNGFKLLDICKSHIKLVENLEYFHRDPFDRLLIASAITENMIFISADENVPKYNVNWLW